MKQRIIIALLGVLLCSCEILNKLMSVENSAENLVSDALTRIEKQSGDWQSVLKGLTDKLTTESQQTIKNEVQNLLNGGIAAAGSEFRCSADFIGNRMKEGLERILATIKNQNLPPLAPVFCSAVPSSIDMNLPPNNRNKVVITGYNFDSQSGLRLLLVGSSGALDVTEMLSKTTNYQMTINLGSNGIQPTSTSNSLVVENNGVRFATIPILQTVLPNCEVIDYDYYVSEPITLTPRRVAGDLEFFGHGPECQADVTIEIRDNRIVARLTMSAEETNGGDTKASGELQNDLFIPTNGDQIVEIRSETSSSCHYIDTTWEKDVPCGSAGSGLVKRFEFYGDGRGNDVGSTTKVTVFFNPIKIRLRKTINCK